MKESIKRSKESIKRSKKSIKRLKKSNYIEKVDKIWIFNINWSLLISVQLKSIDFDLFNIIQACFKKICRYKLKYHFNFRSKKLIQSQFDHDISPFGDLDWLHRLRLETMCFYLLIANSRFLSQNCSCNRLKFEFVYCFY